MNLDISEILIQIVAFLVMLWVLKKFGWGPLLNLLDDRRKKIQSEFDSIAAQEEKVKKIIETYEEKLKGIDVEARHKIQEAIEQGRKIATEIEKNAQANAKATVLKTNDYIKKEIAEAKNQLKTELVNIIIDTTEKILKEKIDDRAHKKLIVDFMEDVEFK